MKNSPVNPEAPFTGASAGAVRLRYLGQAGFVIERRTGATVAVDPYLTDCVERVVGFKRMQPAVTTPLELAPGLVLATHAHLDHLDVDALPAFAARPGTRFVGARDCEAIYRAHRRGSDRYAVLGEGERATVDGVSIRGVYADHGNLAPDALGFLIEVDGVTIYVTGDTAYRPERLLASLREPHVDIMIAPINGAFGNLNAIEACGLAARLRPDRLIACHFWMFVEHGGDPAAFLAEAGRQGLQGLVMAPGERLDIGKGNSCADSPEN